MAFNELELKRIDKTVGALCRRVSPREHADKLRFACEVRGHSVTIYEERAPWNGVGEWTRTGIARFKYTSNRGSWTLYWMRRDLRWHAYDPDAMPADLDSLVALVAEDRYGAFFG